MNLSKVSYELAFIAGLFSFLSPCVIALVPVYISYLGGQSAQKARKGILDRWDTFIHGIAFVLGFSFIFILLGVAASAFGGLLYDFSDWLAKIGGVFVVILGLQMIGIIKIPYLLEDFRYQNSFSKSNGLLASFGMGIFFSAGWSPCVGPVLGAILTISMNGQSVGLGIGLLSAYSLGLAIPFLAAALGIGWVSTILKKYGGFLHYIEIIMGLIIIIVGILLIFDVFSTLARFGSFININL